MSHEKNEMLVQREHSVEDLSCLVLVAGACYFIQIFGGSFLVFFLLYISVLASQLPTVIFVLYFYFVHSLCVHTAHALYILVLKDCHEENCCHVLKIIAEAKAFLYFSVYVI